MMTTDLCPYCERRHRTLTETQCRDRSMTERKLQDRVLYRARKYGWKVVHAGRGMVGENDDGSPIIITPIAPGWPDLVCFKRGHRIIAIELKRETEEPKPEQVEWLVRFNESGARGIVVKPSDLREGRVEAIFRRGDPL